MSVNPMFRINTVARIAVEEANEEEPNDFVGLNSSRPVSDRARISVARIPRTDPMFKEVASALLDAIASLEGELERLRIITELQNRGIELQRQILSIGGDGIFLPKALPFPSGTPVQLFLELEHRGHHRLVNLPAVVEQRADGTELTLHLIPTDMRDMIVGYVFQQQGKERRRARNSDTAD